MGAGNLSCRYISNVVLFARTFLSSLYYLLYSYSLATVGPYYLLSTIARKRAAFQVYSDSDNDFVLDAPSLPPAERPRQPLKPVSTNKCVTKRDIKATSKKVRIITFYKRY